MIELGLHSHGSACSHKLNQVAVLEMDAGSSTPLAVNCSHSDWQLEHCSHKMNQGRVNEAALPWQCIAVTALGKHEGKFRLVAIAGIDSYCARKSPKNSTASTLAISKS
eukprot:1998815-Amphidinium_carterae.3